MYFRCYVCHALVPADDVLYPLPLVGTCLCLTCEREQVRAMEEEMRHAAEQHLPSLPAPLE